MRIKEAVEWSDPSNFVMIPKALVLPLETKDTPYYTQQHEN